MNRAAAILGAAAFAGAAALLARQAGAAPLAWFAAPSAEPEPLPDLSLWTWSAPTDSSAPSVLDSIVGTVTSTFSTWQPPASAAPYLDAIAAAEDANGIPRNLLARLLYQESRFRPEIIDGRVRSSAGAIGIAQFMPATAADERVNPLDPFDSIRGAGRYLAKLYRATGSWSRALAAYNWGVGNVTRRGLDAAPAETRAYYSEILNDVPVA